MIGGQRLEAAGVATTVLIFGTTSVHGSEVVNLKFTNIMPYGHVTCYAVASCLYTTGLMQACFELPAATTCIIN